MYSSTLPIMRQRAVMLSIYTITDNTVTLHQSERHTQSMGTKFSGINSLHHVINPMLPPTDRKEVKICGEKGKIGAQCCPNLSPFFFSLFSVLLSLFICLALLSFLLFSISSTFLSSLHQSILSCSLSQPALMSGGS